MNEKLQSLKEWHDLLSQGIISQEEFDEKKKQLLGLSQQGSTTTEAESKTDRHEDFDKKRPRNSKAITLFALGVVILLASTYWFWPKNNTSIKQKIQQTETAADSTSGDKATADTQNINAAQTEPVRDINEEMKVDQEAMRRAAIKFINGYEAASNSFVNDNSSTTPMESYIMNHALVTDDFRVSYKRFYAEAEFDADPITQSQDPPSSFIDHSINGDVVTVGDASGIYDDYYVKIRLTKINGKWLVDGCGDINF